MSEENSTLQPGSHADDELSKDADAGEHDIDLNLIFPDEDTDLNALFPDNDIRTLLKGISKNKKDLHTIKDRISEENNLPEESDLSSDDNIPPGDLDQD